MLMNTNLDIIITMEIITQRMLDIIIQVLEYIAYIPQNVWGEETPFQTERKKWVCFKTNSWFEGIKEGPLLRFDTDPRVSTQDGPFSLTTPARRRPGPLSDPGENFSDSGYTVEKSHLSEFLTPSIYRICELVKMAARWHIITKF